MDKNFMDKFNFIFGTVQTVLIIVGLIVALYTVSKFSYVLGRLEMRVGVLEDVTPLGQEHIRTE